MTRTTKLMAGFALAMGFLTAGDSAWAQRVGGGGGGNVSFRPGQYNNLGNGLHHNPTTGSLYAPGQAVIKPSGVYTPIGNGYYRNPSTGNVYNPNTGAYIQR